LQFGDRPTDRTARRTKEENNELAKNSICEPAHTLPIGSSTIFNLGLVKSGDVIGP
jgi:hypothetical protein